MKYPLIKRQDVRTVSIDRLDGGLNLRDGQTNCEDNQLTRSLNIWYDGGALKTRPAICENAADIKCALSLTGRLESSDIGSGTTDIYYSRDGEIYRLFWYSFYDGSQYTRFGFRFVSAGSVFELPDITAEGKRKECLCIQHGGYIYAFLGEFGIWRVSFEGEEWERLSDSDFYVPLIMTHCKPGDSIIRGNLAKTGGTAVEDFNLLCPRYRIVYSTVDTQRLAADGNSDYHFMIYYLAESVRGKTEFAGKTVTAKITDSSGSVYTHTVTLDGGTIPVYEAASPGDGLYMRVFMDVVTFHTRSDAGEELARVYATDYVADNLEISAPCTADAERVSRMTCAAWFGETVSGLSGGTRLFLGGSTAEDDRGLILWSEINNPLYFPVSCKAYIGNTNMPVTAFGKQNDALIVFKSNETFYTRTARLRKQNISVNGKDTGVSLQAVYFPMIQLNAAIGCDCPESIQLCRNRLVWATRSGHIYTLLSHSRYNERNIFDISGMIRPSLKSQPELKSGRVFSADWQGFYMLFCSGRVYIMDYNSYGFIYASAGSKAADANLHIPWFYWELNIDKYSSLPFFPILSVLTADGELKINYIYEQFILNSDGARQSSSYYLKTAQPCPEKTEDTEIYPSAQGGAGEESSVPIFSAFKTKLFDFGLPDRLKSVPLIKIMLGNSGGEITATYITDTPDSGDSDIIIPSYSGRESGDYGYTEGIALRPAAGLCRSFGIELSSIGNIELRNITFYYKIAGGAE